MDAVTPNPMSSPCSASNSTCARLPGVVTAAVGGLSSVTEVRTVVSNVPSSLPAVISKSDGTVAIPSGVST